MDCKSTPELLPWLLNGTLKSAQKPLIVRHLTQCENCRDELRETAHIWRVFEQHIPAESMVDLAFGGADAEAPDLWARHLHSCRSCSDELQWIRQSHGLLATEESIHTPLADVEEVRRSGGGWQYALALGGVLLLAFGGGWYFTYRQGNDIRLRIDQLEGEISELRRQETGLRTELDEAAGRLEESQGMIEFLLAPKPNVFSMDVYPHKGAAGLGPWNELKLPDAARAITLVLNTQNRTSYEGYEIEFEEARAGMIWTGKGLVRGPAGDFSIHVPVGFLKPGEYSIVIYGEKNGERSRLDIYSLRVNPETG